jgi:2-methylcitrate dehydratase PrpD
MAFLTDVLGAFVYDLDLPDVPSEVVDRARDRVLDALSTSVAARNVATTLAVSAAAEVLGHADRCCTILPTGAGGSADNAALINGSAVHAILFEDVNASSADHPGAVVVPAALCAAEAAARYTGRTATMGELLLGVLAGYEVQLWLGAIAADGVRARGFRTTAVFGSVSAAAAVAKVLRLSRDECARALAMGANTAFGVLEGFAHGTMEPYVQAGIAARNGLLAALLARSGVMTAAETFEGPHGYLRAYADTPGSVILSNHDSWRILGVLCKPYPISGAKIAGVDSALDVLAQGVAPGDIRSVVVRLPAGIMEFPGSDKVGPFTTMNEAQDSAQFCVAAALLGRPMSSLRTVMDEFADPQVSELTQRIALVSESDRLLTRVEVTLADGRLVVGEADRAEQLVPSIAKMTKKLGELTADFWAPGVTDAVVEVVLGPIDAPITELTRLIRGR